jgi:hypothetical protein
LGSIEFFDSSRRGINQKTKDKYMAKKTGASVKVSPAEVLSVLKDLTAALGGTKAAKPSKAKKAAVKAAARVVAVAAATSLTGNKTADIAALLAEKATLQAEKAVIQAELIAGTRKPGDGAYRGRRLRISEINSTLTKLGHKWEAKVAAA